MPLACFNASTTWFKACPLYIVMQVVLLKPNTARASQLESINKPFQIHEICSCPCQRLEASLNSVQKIVLWCKNFSHRVKGRFFTTFVNNWKKWNIDQLNDSLRPPKYQVYRSNENPGSLPSHNSLEKSNPISKAQPFASCLTSVTFQNPMNKIKLALVIMTSSVLKKLKMQIFWDLQNILKCIIWATWTGHGTKSALAQLQMTYMSTSLKSLSNMESCEPGGDWKYWKESTLTRSTH